MSENQISQWLLEPSSPLTSDIDEVEEIQDDNELEDSDIGEPENSNHDSASDASGNENERIEEEDQHDNPGLHYLGRDNETVWNIHPRPGNRRRARRNIVIHPPGVTRAAQHANTISDAWSLFFQIICYMTL